MKKYFLILPILLLVLSACSGSVDNGAKPEATFNFDKEIIFYYGETCPHCHDVKKYFTENNTHSKIQFMEKEVYNNRDNQNDLVKTAEYCGLNTKKIGVPFLWTGQECLIGQPDIEGFFETRTQ